MAFDSQRRSWAARRMLSRKPALGTGQRFAALKEKLGNRPGVSNPGALAAWIGRRKYGAQRMANWAAHGRQSNRVSHRAAALRRG